MCYKECPPGKESNSDDKCFDIPTPDSDITIDIDIVQEKLP